MVEAVLSDDGVYELDVSGYLCPFPVLKAAKVMRKLQKSDYLRVISTDSGSWEDFVHFAEQGGHELLQRHREGERYIFLLRKDIIGV